MTPVVANLIRNAGLWPLWEARSLGDREEIVRSPSWHTADLMALGAIADAIRSREVSDNVSVYLSGGAPQTIRGTGLSLLRECAIARIRSAIGASIVVDWSTCGLELAQVALGFGANALAGPLRTKRGLPIAEDATKKIKGEGQVSQLEIQRREVERVLLGARRVPRFIVEEEGHAEARGH